MKTFGKVMLWILFPMIMVGRLAYKVCTKKGMKTGKAVFMGIGTSTAVSLALFIVIGVSGGTQQGIEAGKQAASQQLQQQTQEMDATTKVQLYLLARNEKGVWERIFKGEAQNLDGSVKDIKTAASERWSMYATVPPIGKNESLVKEMYKSGTTLATKTKVYYDLQTNMYAKNEFMDAYADFILKCDEIMTKYEADYKKFKS